ncbi:MAG: proline/glycine betaine ABC transporter permease [Alicyclobacillaceae bacterium]|jgi:glycine betaine/proline transport system permease protein|uniref:ABC transporter permease n=1 Tax=Alicyclobacillus sp. SP_1 TaxID=2942475 RepID=UPI00215858CD|nr:proline/glycine betaine ABC transporter permease [Alicyclobacillus sp. SP_1]MCY0887033.1 proline/glycine betaine ABC transporter permease [Alicyclobacillaceae bacterium]
MLPRLPLAAWVNDIVHWLYVLIGPFLGDVANVIRVVVDGATNGLSAVPWWIVVLVLAVLAYLSGKWKLTLGTIIGLTLIFDLGLWDDMITTLVLVILSALVSVVIGLPLGIWSAKSRKAYRVIAPLLDLMQTMPSFVYLVPVLIFFDIGLVPAIFATVIFAMPPAIRLTRLGILQVPGNLVEAATAFGTTDWQLLWKVQIPLAIPSIKAGVNQTIMLSLSMVVIASMIGAGGLGADVMSALETVNVGQGFEAGISIVILAIILDRVSQKLGRDKPIMVESD